MLKFKLLLAGIIVITILALFSENGFSIIQNTEHYNNSFVIKPSANQGDNVIVINPTANEINKGHLSNKIIPLQVITPQGQPQGKGAPVVEKAVNYAFMFLGGIFLYGFFLMIFKKKEEEEKEKEEGEENLEE